MITADIKGRILESRSIRLLPEVTGAFVHTVEEIDRLDHLAYKYYGTSDKWWQICDANADFLSPQSLLGKEPVVMNRFPLTYDDETGKPPWADLRRQLIEKVGVEDVQVVEKAYVIPEEQTIEGSRITVYQDRFELSVVVIFNVMNVDVKELTDVMEKIGFTVGAPEAIGRTGKTIIIPPDEVS